MSFIKKPVSASHSTLVVHGSCLCCSLQTNDNKNVKQVEPRVELKNTKRKPPKCKLFHLNCSLCVFITVHYISSKPGLFLFKRFFFQPTENVKMLRYLEMFLPFLPGIRAVSVTVGGVCVRDVAGPGHVLQPLCVLWHLKHSETPSLHSSPLAFQKCVVWANRTI